MRVTWWKLDDTMGLVSADPDPALDSWRRKASSFWVDVEGYEPKELEAWLREIRLSDAARECCLEAGEMSRIVPLEEAVFFEFPVHAEGVESELVELGFLCLTGLVITLHQGSIAPLERIDEVMKHGAHRRKVTTSDLVAMILLSLSSQRVRLAGDLRRYDPETRSRWTKTSPGAGGHTGSYRLRRSPS